MDEIIIGPGCKISAGEAFGMPIIDLAYTGMDKVTLSFEGTDEEIKALATQLCLEAAWVVHEASRRIAERG